MFKFTMILIMCRGHNPRGQRGAGREPVDGADDAAADGGALHRRLPRADDRCREDVGVHQSAQRRKPGSGK